MKFPLRFPVVFLIAFLFGNEGLLSARAADPPPKPDRETLMAEDSLPNVLFLAIDDLNDWIGALGGHPQAKTPNLDRLISQECPLSQCPLCGTGLQCLAACSVEWSATVDHGLVLEHVKELEELRADAGRNGADADALQTQRLQDAGRRQDLSQRNQRRQRLRLLG